MACALIVTLSMSAGVIAVGATSGSGPATAGAGTGTSAPTDPATSADGLADAVDTADTTREAGLAAAQQALASRQRGADADAAARLAVERTNVRGAGTLLSIADDGDAGSVAAAADLAAAGVSLQAAQRSGGDPAAVDLPATETATPTHASPSAAVFAILDRHGVEPTAEQARDIRALDELPESTRRELTDLLDAQLAYERAVQSAYAGVDSESVQSAGDGDVAVEAGASAAGVDVDRVRAAQVDLVRAAGTLRSVIARAGPNGNPTSGADAPVDGVRVPGVVSIDVSNDDNTYTTDYAFQVDVGGDDTYDNNAGGAVGTGAPPENEPNPDAAGLVDLGGDDAYNGRNGGGDDVAVGFLVDAGRGDDTYDAQSGDFDPDGHGVNGGGNVVSLGFLLDTAGDDTYQAGDNGTNGGGHNLGTGFLLDTGGEDTYTAGSGGTNGGARGLARGFLLDTAGEETYTATSLGTNGGGHSGGVGVLIDAGTGDDAYRATSGGTNGGGGFDSPGGFLLDAGGADVYQAGGRGTNGGSFVNGPGLLLDIGAGGDTIAAGTWATNGGGYFGYGFLVNVGQGDDTYEAGDDGANGGAWLDGYGLLLDTAGDDTYEAGEDATNGGVSAERAFILGRVPVNHSQGDPAVGLLVDYSGTDYYNDSDVTCTDCSKVPKGAGNVGAQVDSDDPAVAP